MVAAGPERPDGGQAQAQAPGRPAPSADRRRGMSPGVQLTLAVVLCAAGAALALYASSKNWSVEVMRRPAPLPAVRTVRSGADFVPWVPALALVSLAGAGALVATRRAGRTVIGGLLVLLGLGVAVGAAVGLSAATGEVGSTGPGWPVVTLIGGLVVTAVGTLALRRGRRWPTMGSRYERAATRTTVGAEDDPARVWDALDSGDDPTVR